VDPSVTSESHDVNRGNIEPIKLSDQLDFIPSETNFTQASKLLEGEIEYTGYAGAFLDRIIQTLTNYDYIVIDTQAGPVQTTREAIWRSDKVVIVMGSDITIGLAAVKNLLHKFADVLKGREPFCVINGLLSAEAKFYDISGFLEGIPLLKPIPFDEGVRLAFLTRKIPIDTKEASGFVFGLTRNAKVLFPKLEGEIEEFERGKFGKLEGKIKETEERLDNIRRNLVAQARSIFGRYVMKMSLIMLACLVVFIIPTIILNLVSPATKDFYTIIALLIGTALAGFSGWKLAQKYGRLETKPLLETDSEDLLLHLITKRDGYELILATQKENRTSENNISESDRK